MKRTLVAAWTLAFGLAAIPVAPGAAAEETPRILQTGTVKWSPGPQILPEGAEVSVLAGDPSDGFFVMRIRFPANASMPPHWMNRVEHITVLEGTFHIGTGETFDQADTTAVSAGGFISIPADVRHFGWTEEATVLQAVGIGPTEVEFVPSQDAQS